MDSADLELLSHIGLRNAKIEFPELVDFSLLLA